MAGPWEKAVFPACPGAALESMKTHLSGARRSAFSESSWSLSPWTSSFHPIGDRKMKEGLRITTIIKHWHYYNSELQNKTTKISFSDA